MAVTDPINELIEAERSFERAALEALSLLAELPPGDEAEVRYATAAVTFALLAVKDGLDDLPISP